MLRRLFCVGIVLSFLLVWAQTNITSVVALQSATQTPLPTATPSPIPVNKIAFTMQIEDADGEGFHSQIFVLDLAEGSTPINWSNNAYDEREPAWSPDGTRLAFSSNQDATSLLRRDLYVANVDGSNRIQLTNGGLINSDPAWSPDSQTIIFSSTRTGNGDIYYTRSDGSRLNDPNRITDNLAVEYDPDWSILNKIVYVVATTMHMQSGDIFTMNPNGSGITSISPNPANDENPTWSPDGKKIIFTSDRVATGQSDIYIMNGYGCNPIVSSADAPAWSPDGTQIIYSLRHAVKGTESYRLMFQYLNFPLQQTLYQDTVVIADLDWSPGQANIPAACNFSLLPEDCNDLVDGLMGIDVTRQPSE